MATGFAAIKGEDPALCILGHYLFHCFITEKGFIACLTKALEGQELCSLDYFFISLLNRAFITSLKLNGTKILYTDFIVYFVHFITAKGVHSLLK